MLREKISGSLNLPVPYLEKLARSASHRYKTYTIPKRSGGERTIHHPSRELKAVQKWLLREFLDGWPVHDAAHAYEKGRNTRTNAEVHVGTRFLLRMDFEDFFPSLTSDDVHAYLASHGDLTNDWEEDDSIFFVNLVSRHGKLTIGAPTSPKLSNILCYELDARLKEVTAAVDASYSRYADDVFFSCDHKDVLPSVEEKVPQVVGELEIPENLSINEDKTHHSSKKGRMVVTGLVLTPQGDISVGRDKKRRIQAQVHQYDELEASEQAGLKGWLSYIESVEPDFINRLVMKYGAEHMERVISQNNVHEG